MDPIREFEEERKERIADYPKNEKFVKAAYEFTKESIPAKYSYNFSWMGRPIIQYPQDIIAMQELIWKIKPDLIIDIGIAHGGSAIFSASILELIGKGEVLAIDIDIRKHNREKIEEHPMYKRITMLEGSSISDEIIEKVKEIARGKEKVMVFLDSHHSHNHVLKELQLYSPFVTNGSYIVAFDSFIEDFPNELFYDKVWGKENNPKTAVTEFLKNNDDFIIDKEIENKLLITVVSDGYLKRVR